MLIDTRKEVYTGDKFTRRLDSNPAAHTVYDAQTLKPVNGAFHPIHPEVAATLEAFRLNHKGSLSMLGKGLKGAHVRNIVLEGGHIYGDETPGATHAADVRTTALLNAHLTEEGFSVKNLLMVDDFHANENTLDINTYIEQAAALGWHIDHLVMESSLTPIAETMIDCLKKRGKTHVEGKGLVLDDGRKGAHLIGPDDGILSCASLDAALCLVKHQILGANGIINVLPRRLRGQQKNTRDIVRSIVDERRLPFYNWFMDLDSSNSFAGAPHYFR